MTTFVSVGNATQPFGRLLDQVSRIADALPRPVVVQHGSSPFEAGACVTRPFVDTAEFDTYIAKAELLILHAGAGSVIHSIRAGKVPVVMPRRLMYGEAVDDHQLEFARVLEEAGKVVLALEPEDLMDAVAQALRRQRVAAAHDGTPRMVTLVGEALRRYAGGRGR